MAIKKNKKGDFITSEDVSKMKYTNKVHIVYNQVEVPS